MLDVCDKEQETGRASAELLRRSTRQCFMSSWKVFVSPFLWLIYLKEIKTNRTLFFFFTRQVERKKKKDNHPAVCMTRKHQLKTIRCIPYYFMLGWNLSACINSLYKLKTGWFQGRPLCWGSQCGSVFRRVVVSFRGCGGSRAQSPSSCIVVPTVRDEDKEAAQARLCFAEFSGWVLGGRGMIPC